MIVCAEEIYVQLYDFLKYIINRWLKPCIILKILVSMPFNETIPININFTEENSSICKFCEEEINYQLSMK